MSNPNFYRFYSLFSREVKRYYRVLGQTLLTPMVNATLYLMIFGVSVGKHIDVGNDTSYLLFLIPGLVMMGVLNNAFQNGASSVMTAKFAGELEDLKTTPLTPNQIVWAKSLSSLSRGLLVGLAIGITAQIFCYVQNGYLFGVAHPFILLFFLVCGGCAFGQLGIAVGFFAKTFDQMNSFGAFILLPLIYLGGVFFSLDHLHPFWEGVSKLNPLLYLVNGVRYSVLGFSDVGLLHAASVSVATLAICTTSAYISITRGSYHRF